MSDMLVEKAEVGKITLRSEDPRITPKNIAEGDIDIAIRDVIRESQEKRLSLTASAIVESANATTITRLKNLVPEKARHVLRISVHQVALTAVGLSILISSGCGNVENPSITPTNTPEPTSVSAPIAELTQTPTLIPTAVLRPTEAPKPSEPEYEYVEFNNIKVSIDKDGLPFKYILPDGREVFLDKEKVFKAREGAILLKSQK